jgi:small ligand-binding sensory domain FIST
VLGAAGISTKSDDRLAVREAAEAARAGLPGEPVAGALLLAASHGRGDLTGILRSAGEILGTSRIAGASVHGVLACGQEAEGEPAVAVLALAGLEIEPLLVRDLAGREAVAGSEILGRLSARPRASDLVVLFCDATTLSLRPLLAGLDAALAPGVLVGAGAANGAEAFQWLGTEVVRGAASGLVLRGAHPPRVRVSHACRPVTPPLTVSRASGHWVQALDGRPALDVYRETARGPLAEDLRRASSFLMVALPAPGDEALARGRYRTRNVVGFSEEQRAFALPEAVSPRQELALVLREPEGARDALRAMLSEAATPRPALALYFSCAGRGSSLFGVSGLEAGYLQQALGDVPWIGMHAPSQIAPLGARTELLTYTGVLALLDA